MANPFVVKNIAQAIETKSLPTIKVWNRLEARPRTNNFDRALKAEVRDALWMLAKQWQMGEFEGDDAASPVVAKVHIATTRLTKYKVGDKPTVSFDNSVPLETTVEKQTVKLAWHQQVMRIDLRLQLGRRWLKLLAKDPLIQGLAGNYKTGYAFHLPAEDEAGDYVYAHKDSWQQYAALDGRAMDGGALYLYLAGDPGHRASDSIAMSGAQANAVNALVEGWMKWFEKELYCQPGAEEDAWRPSYLEYNFSVSAPQGGHEKVLVADEYYSGHLDWYSLDIDPASPGLAPPAPAIPAAPPVDPIEAVYTRTFLPTAISFDGMPNTRWWKFEEGKTNFGDIRPSTSELGKMLLMEFGLVYANDWFIIPFKAPVGTLADVKGLTVTNTFGERLWIEASGRGPDDSWHRWNMFTMNIKGKTGEKADTSVALLPTAPKIQESDPLEEMVVVRDEMANMVWAIETKIPLVSGFSKGGKEVAEEILGYQTRLIQKNGPVAPPPYVANISYLSMTSVPENWIPFIPVHLPGSNREIQLQRAAMLRIIEGADPALKPPKIEPRTTLLRFGLDETPAQSYFVHEEEVPKAGIKLTQSFQRTRWMDGKVFVWLGLRKETGRGEGSSGLAFDQVKDVKKADA